MATMNGDLNMAQISTMLPDKSDEELLGGPSAVKEREVIESNRVKLTNYIHDVTNLFPVLRQNGLFNRDDVEIISSHVTTTAKVDKFLDVLLTKGPRAIGVFHEALSSHYLHLFNYLAQLFTQAGLELPPSRQMKDEETVLEEKGPLDIKHSRSNSSYRNGSRSLTVRKRLEVMSRQCEMMEKDKDQLQRALGDREKEISSLLSCKEHVQSSLNTVTGQYQELLSQLSRWRSVLESDDAVKEWTVEREGIQREYDQMEQEYNLQCSELNAARDRISRLLQQLERSEQMVSITEESCQKEKDILKHKIAVHEGEIQRLLDKLDNVIKPGGKAKGVGESPEVRCEKLQRDVEKANEQISNLKERLEVVQKEKTQAYDEKEEMVARQYDESKKRKAAEKENRFLKKEIDSISNHSDAQPSPMTPYKNAPWLANPFSSAEVSGKAAVRVETMEVFMPAPETSADLPLQGMKLELAIVVKELKEGSLPHKHGVRIGDEICQLNNITLSGDKEPLEFFNRLLSSASPTVTLTLRRQVQIQDSSRPLASTLPPGHLTLSTTSPRSHSPSYVHSHSLPFPTPTSAIFPLNPQLGSSTLARKAFQSLTPSSSPVNASSQEPSSLDHKTSPKLLQRNNAPCGQSCASGTSNSTHSTNKDSLSCSSSEDDVEGPRKRVRGSPIIIRQQRPKEARNNRISTNSQQSGIVGSPTEKTAVWRDSTMTRAPTIDSGYEFPITDDFQVHGVLGVEKENEEEESKGILMSEGWDVVEPEEDHGGGGEESGDRRERSGGRVRHAVRSHDKERHTGPLGRKKGYYNKRNISKSLDDLNEMQGSKPLPQRIVSRDAERTVTLTKEVFTSEINLIGGRGYGVFIQTDSRKLNVETGDEILEIGDKTILGLTRAEVVDLLESFFSRKQPAPLTVMYNTKALSQLPPEAKDDFHVRCMQSYRPPHSILGKNNELPFERGDVLHITNTISAGHAGFWQAQRVGSKGEVLAQGLVPILLSPELTDECGTVSLPQRFRNIGSPKQGIKQAKSHTFDDRVPASSVAKAFTLYKPIRRLLGVQDPRPVVLLGALQRDIRRHLINLKFGSSDDIKFHYATREEESKKRDEDDIVERLHLDSKDMVSTTSHIRDLAIEGYHCVLCIDAEDLNRHGLLSLIPIVLLLYTTGQRTINKIRQSATLPQDLEFNIQEELDYVESLKRYRQYFTGQIDLQGSMSDVVKDIRAAVACQQKSIIWESEQ